MSEEKFEVLVPAVEVAVKYQSDSPTASRRLVLPEIRIGRNFPSPDSTIVPTASSREDFQVQQWGVDRGTPQSVNGNVQPFWIVRQFGMKLEKSCGRSQPAS